MKKNLIKIIGAAFIALIFSSCSKNESDALGVVSSVISVKFVKGLHNGDDVTLVKEKMMDATFISGVVISDKNSGNFDSKEFVLQNTSKGAAVGMVIKLKDANTTINYGDSVTVEIENATLTRERGVMKIKGENLDLSKVTKISSGNVVVPMVLTATQLFSQFYLRESTLVQVKNVTIPDLEGGEVFSGERRFDENPNVALFLNTAASASFAQKFLPAVASFNVIPTYDNATSDYYNTAKLLVKMPNGDAVFNQTGSVYFNFPEDFEMASASSKSDYLMPGIDDKVTFKTGVWKIYQGVIGDRINEDKFNPRGFQAIRLQEQLSVSAYLEMDFDLPNGASQVTFSYGSTKPSTGTAVASTFDLEYSKDGGNTWVKVDNSLTSDVTLVRSASFSLDISGAVRFRINKLGLGLNGAAVKNGLLNIDDFRIYQNVD